MTAEPTTRAGLTLALRAGDALFRLDAQDAGEILRAPRLTRVPNAPAALEGLASLRGAVLPVFSLARLLDVTTSSTRAPAFVLVLAGEAMGLAVDHVSTLQASEFEATPVRPLDLEKIAREHLHNGGRAARAARPAATSVATEAVDDASRALLGFALAGQDYAFALSDVDEVLAVPADATTLPLTAAADLGVVALRGALLPLLSLRALLGLPPASAGASRHMIIVRFGSARVGLVVDQLASVRRLRAESISPVPSILNRGEGEARIVEIARCEDGRLMSILSTERLFADPDLARRIAATHQESTTMQTDAVDERQEKIVVFRLGDEEFGLPIAAVDEIARLPDAITRVPRAPGFVKGVMNLRGRVVPLIDQGARFGVATSETSSASRRRVIVTELKGLIAGFIVDEVREVLTLRASQITAAPTIAATKAQSFDRVAMLESEGRMILLVDPVELLSRAERDLLARESWSETSAAGA